MLKADKFSAGDLVQTKAGGPKMVVDKVVPSSVSGTTYYCVWWIGNKCCREALQEASLIAWQEPT